MGRFRNSSDQVQLTEFSELTVGEDKGPKSPQTIQRLVAVLFRGVPINGGTGKLSIATRHLLRLPDKVLQQIARVLGEKHVLGLLDHITEVGN